MYDLTRVSFPNYFFEILIWIVWNILFFSIPALLFLVAGAGQMVVWAKKKHENYLATFNGKDGKELYPRDRTAVIPFIY